MSTRWIKMGMMSDKLKQDGAKMRKMEDVSSVLGPLGGEDLPRPANIPAARGPGEVPPLGWENTSPPQLSNPNSGALASKISVSLETSSNSGAPPSRFTMFF